MEGFAQSTGVFFGLGWVDKKLAVIVRADNKRKTFNFKIIYRMAKEQKELTNEKLKNYSFLDEMYQDKYFPNNCVDMGKEILIDLCFQIEKEKPKTLEELYKLTHKATEKFNDLEEVFDENDSEIETVARDCIGTDFLYIANSYDFTEADNEELIATREW